MKSSLHASSLGRDKPIGLRVAAFRDYFLNKKINVTICAGRNDGSMEAPYFIFITMPPFCGFMNFLQRKKIILDIRDGWSIAQETGYGGNVKPKPFKAWLTRKIEWFLIRRSCLTITCTPGLQKHLERVSGKKVVLIPNGISEQRLSLINELKSGVRKKKSDRLIFVCAGQFSEYGVDKVNKLLSVINERYGIHETEIRLIGSSAQHNQWVTDYYSNISNGRGVVNILPRMNEADLYKSMLEADFGLSIVRDPGYEFGTKVYDYIALGLPVVNYFDEPNNFTDYFDACLDVGFGRNHEVPEIRRSVLIEKGLKDIEF
ncbi:MAG: hypothetical protein IBX57_11700 [Gammaproteobacteria bacterium]|nr:hypothetical protein [Gammaproteobacteria bacterium]